MYCEKEASLNSIIEVLGIISLSSTDLNSQDERGEFHPPSTIIPRIHCLIANKWMHNNPCMPRIQGLQTEAGRMSPLTIDILCRFISFLPLDLANSMSGFFKVRDELHGLFTDFYAGDSLAADYLLCHLASHV